MLSRVLETFGRLLGYVPLPEHVPVSDWMNSGLPPKDLSWNEATSKFNWTAFGEDLPRNCYSCGEACSLHLSDLIKIEGCSQYMVRTKYCPKGHGFNVWIA